MSKVLRTEKLNLPVIKGTLPAARYLSMDDYVNFVTLNLKYIVDRREAIKKAVEILLYIFNHGAEAAMTHYHQ